MTRSAVDTIKGYYYQFDLTIFQLLKVKAASDKIIVESIEDIDVHSANETSAIQCKYYSKTEYNHSVIAKSIRLMITHYNGLKKNGEKVIKYHLYGFYSSGQQKLTLPLTKEYLKKNFLTYKRKGKKNEIHKKLSLSNTQLDEFISLLSININAPSYESQIKEIVALLRKEFNCSEIDAKEYYYNNSLGKIKDLATQPAINDRTLTKKKFISIINKKEDLFHDWYSEFLGREKFFKKMKKDHFTDLNVSAFDRFFLIEVDPSKYVRNEIKELIYLISNKWSKTSKRELLAFCPYVYISGIPKNELIELKKELSNENFGFIDGHNFLGSDFDVKSIMSEPKYYTAIKVKIINEIRDLDAILKESNLTKQMFQFYTNYVFYKNSDTNLKHLKIQVHQIKEIAKII